MTNYAYLFRTIATIRLPNNGWQGAYVEFKNPETGDIGKAGIQPPNDGISYNDGDQVEFQLNHPDGNGQYTYSYNPLH